MKEIKETCYKGTRILLGNEKRKRINRMIDFLIDNDFQEIQIPIIQHQEIFQNKVGQENNNLMFNFTDRGNRNLCLAPEYTAVVQELSKTVFKDQKDVKLFYIQECFRGEKPQLGRYRQFTQLGVEILNPTQDWSKELIRITHNLINYRPKYKLILNNVRGLDYYKNFTFEIQHKESKLSICGGGSYENGIGFAIGIDRLLTLK
jgi:histidyl-tRNA synthetase